MEGSLQGKWRRPGREALLLLYVPVYLMLFMAAERLITADYWVSWCALDDAIPFVKEFVFAYVLWYPMAICAALWLLAQDGRAFVRYALLMIASLTACIAIFFLLPSGQELRPAAVEGSGLAALLVRAIYAADTNTNVFPSMHVAGTLAALAGLWDSDTVGSCARWGSTLLGLCIILSTLFIKQHSALDVISGIALFLVIHPVIYLFPGRK